jgi:plastocyanin
MSILSIFFQIVDKFLDHSSICINDKLFSEVIEMFFTIRKKYVGMFFLICVAIVAAWVIVKIQPNAIPSLKTDNTEQVRTINLVTGEFKAETEEGKVIEAYRWDPGTIFVNKGEKVNLSIYGVNGKEHPFSIEGTKITGTVQQGKETIVSVQFQEEGVFRLICHTHPDIAHNGPMIAYIVVD